MGLVGSGLVGAAEALTAHEDFQAQAAWVEVALVRSG